MKAQGWKFIPTWVGPQSAGYGGCSHHISNNTSTAYQQGQNEADAALNVVNSLGLGDTVIYYDLEAYTNNTTYRNAAKSFISGWSARMQEHGSKAGVYGSSCAAHLSDLAGISHVPDAIWPAAWFWPSGQGHYDPNASVWNVPCISDSKWRYHQRIRQYAGGHNETWGNLTLRIDSNVIDGVVAAPGTQDSTVVVVEDPDITPSYSGTCTSHWYRFSNNRGHYAYLTLNTDRVAYSTNAATWRANLPTSGVYKVEAYIAHHGTIRWQCPSRNVGWDTEDARYSIYHANGRTDKSASQKPVDNAWLDLGTYAFSANSEAKVTLSDLNGEPHLSHPVSFSAVRFTLIEETQDPGDPTVVEDPAIHPAYDGMCGSAWYRFSNNRGHDAYLTLNTNDPNQSTNWARWQPNIPTTGSYRVEALIAYHPSIDWQCPSKHIGWDTSDARYVIHYADGQRTVSGNQKPLNNEWLDLGVYRFNAGTDGWVELHDVNGEANLSRTISFSAVRFVPQEEAVDTVKPWGEITWPVNTPIVNDGITIQADAEDNNGGSGVKQVRFWLQYADSPQSSSSWHNVGDITSPPYEAQWTPPEGLRSQLIMVGIHVEDNADQYCIDPSPSHPGECYDKEHALQPFIYNQVGVTEYWIPADLRAYLNQRSLTDGDEKCGAASSVMMLAMNEKIGGDYDSMANVAQGLPGDSKAKKYVDILNSRYGLGVVEKTYSFFNDEDDLWWDVVHSVINNKPVMLLTRQFTDGGHYVVIIGYRQQNGIKEFIVYDPFGRWQGERDVYDKNDTSRYSVKGRWVWYKVDDIWPSTWDPFEFKKRKPYLIISESVLNMSNASRPLTEQTPNSPPDVISTEEPDIGTYEGIPMGTEIYLPLVLRGQ